MIKIMSWITYSEESGHGEDSSSESNGGHLSLIIVVWEAGNGVGDTILFIIVLNFGILNTGDEWGSILIKVFTAAFGLTGASINGAVLGNSGGNKEGKEFH